MQPASQSLRQHALARAHQPATDQQPWAPQGVGVPRRQMARPVSGFERHTFLPDRHGILLIVDEVQSAMGRTGQLWAVQHVGGRGPCVRRRGVEFP
jgi:Aminotransferase class-III